jgi:glycine cleavage system H protein
VPADESYPTDLRYHPEHDWVRPEGDEATFGITWYAQDALGDVVFVQVPTMGAEVKAGDRVSEIESTKSVSDIYAPISGVIVEVNTDLAEEPQRVNDDPYGDGWLCVLRPADLSELDSLLDAAAYQAIVDG